MFSQYKWQLFHNKYLQTAAGPAAAGVQFVGEGRYREGGQVMGGLSGIAGRSQTGSPHPSQPCHSLDDENINQKTQFVRRRKNKMQTRTVGRENFKE